MNEISYSEEVFTELRLCLVDFRQTIINAGPQEQFEDAPQMPDDVSLIFSESCRLDNMLIAAQKTRGFINPLRHSVMAAGQVLMAAKQRKESK